MVLVLLLLCRWWRTVLMVSLILWLTIWLRGRTMVIADIWLMCYRRVRVLPVVRMIHRRLPRCHIRFLRSILIRSSSGLQLLLWCSRRHSNRSWLEWVGSGVRALRESWHWWGWWLDSVQEIALRVVLGLRRVFGILRPSFSRRLAEIVPEAVLLAEINLGNSASDLRSSMPFSPLVL
jgi:hypothetical protein